MPRRSRRSRSTRRWPASARSTRTSGRRRAFDSWLDMRCQPYIEAMDRQAGDRITELTGCAPTCDHGPKILWWMHERPADFARIAKFVTPAGYVAGTMAGLKADQAFMDYTFIHFTGFSDSKAVAWSPELCDRFGLDRSKLPEIVEPWRVVGEVTPAAARILAWLPGPRWPRAAATRRRAPWAQARWCPGWCSTPRGPRRCWRPAPTSSWPTGSTVRCSACTRSSRGSTTRWPTSPAAGSRCAGSAISSTTRCAARSSPGRAISTRR